jgi:hypothetical protein
MYDRTEKYDLPLRKSIVLCTSLASVSIIRGKAMILQDVEENE